MVPLKERIRFKPGKLSREWMVFIMSVLLAFLVWLLVNLSQDYFGTVSVPVVAQCNIEGYATESSNTVLVSARCRTDGFRLVREQSRREKKLVRVRFDRQDLRRTGPDEYSVIGGVKNSYINQFFGDGANVEAFISDTLRFIFQAERHKKVPVEVPVSFTCRSQYMPSGPFRVSPDSVTVYASDERLEVIEKVTAARLQISDLSESQHGILRLNRQQDVRYSVDEVSYELPITRYVELRTTVPMEVWNVPAGHSVQVYPAQATVHMRCVFPLAKDPVPDFKLYIDYKDFSASMSGRCAPRTLRLPAGVLEYRVEPEVFDCIEL